MVRLAGPADYSRLIKIPAVKATIGTDQNSQTAPASFRRVGSDYEIVIDTSSLRLPETDLAYIRLTFDSFFAPKTKEPGNDTRELVVKAPVVVQLFR